VKRWLPYVALTGVVVIALAVAASRSEAPRTPAARANAIANGVRCPTCRSLSAAESDAPAALAVRDEIRRRVDAGQSDAEIRLFLVSRYGREILLKPEGRGTAALVWVLPVIAAAWAIGALAFAFKRWSSRPMHHADADDRAIVERALGDV
jgi:cytochrome c-type biogenesis protein CcmH